MNDLKSIKAQALQSIDRSFHHLQEAASIVFDDMMTEELDQLFKFAVYALADLKEAFSEETVEVRAIASEAAELQVARQKMAFWNCERTNCYGKRRS